MSWRMKKMCSKCRLDKIQLLDMDGYKQFLKSPAEEELMRLKRRIYEQAETIKRQTMIISEQAKIITDQAKLISKTV